MTVAKPTKNRSRLAVLATHPIQYHSPLYRSLTGVVDLHVFYANEGNAADQISAGFGHAFSWDTDLLSGYSHSFLENVSSRPGTSSFSGSDTPDIGDRLKEGEFTHVLSMGWYLKSQIQGIVAAKRAGMSVLIRGDSHLVTPRSFLKRSVKMLVYPLLLRTFDAVLYVGSRNHDYYRHYFIPEERMFFSPHAVDNEHFAKGAQESIRMATRKKMGISESQFAILYVGRLLDFKHPEHLINAAAKLREKGVDAVVVVAGAGAMEEQLRTMAKAAGVPLPFLGFVNQQDLPGIYAAADVLMLPSQMESWGLVCNESLAAGTPILVSDAVGCAPDLASDGIAGRKYSFGDINGAVSQLSAIAASPPPKAAVEALSNRYSPAAASCGVLQAVHATSGLN